MNVAYTFLLGLILTMGVVFVALLYMRNPLLAVLTDLCGTVDRARFWTAFSNITLFLVPLVFALNVRPTNGSIESGVFAVSDQIQAALKGLIVSSFALAIVLGWHIAGHRPAPHPQDASGPQEQI